MSQNQVVQSVLVSSSVPVHRSTMVALPVWYVTASIKSVAVVALLTTFSSSSGSSLSVSCCSLPCKLWESLRSSTPSTALSFPTVAASSTKLGMEPEYIGSIKIYSNNIYLQGLRNGLGLRNRMAYRPALRNHRRGYHHFVLERNQYRRLDRCFPFPPLRRPILWCTRIR